MSLRLGVLLTWILGGCGLMVDLTPDPRIPDGGADGDGDGDGGQVDGGQPPCAGADDCERFRGAPPCGTWVCNDGACEADCPGCTDADRDGYGPEPGLCAGPDCDDGNPNLTDVGRRRCYTGPPDAAGVGACARGYERCDGGVWSGVCEDEVLPMPEACNGVDDDCNGAIDENGADCRATHGAPPCGAWQCNNATCEVFCPGCTDGDRDGYGPEAVCAGLDCDDADSSVLSDAVDSCYTGPPGSDGTGVCRAGTTTCVAGLWSPCTGEVVPSGEACNDEDDDCDGRVDEDLGDFTCGVGACETRVAACGAGGTVGQCVPGGGGGRDDDCDGIDDDCDGAIDDDCIASCVAVSRAGNDGTGDGTPARPYRTIQWAIDHADEGQFVCVAAGSACGNSATYAEAITMRDGISVYGGYQSTQPWSRCGNSTTILQPPNAEGVLFPDTVSETTGIDGFRIDRAPLGTSAGITVDGAINVIVSNIVMNENTSNVVIESWGVNLVNGGEALITGSIIYGGNGSAESIGVRSVGARPTIRDNCLSPNAAGRCDDDCGWIGSNRGGIRGRYVAGTGVTWGVLLDDSAESSIERTAICGVVGDEGAGVRVTGDSDQVLLRGNFVGGWGGLTSSIGISLEDCGGSAPWIVDNETVRADGPDPLTEAVGIRSLGDCHPVIDSNREISASFELASAVTIGVACDRTALGPSRCTVLGNALIAGSSGGAPPLSIGVRCGEGSCQRIEDNTIDGRGGVVSIGLELTRTGTFVNDNWIAGGCAGASAVGVHSDDAFARLQNNLVTGGTCHAPSNRGILALVRPGGFELDVHSNDIHAGGVADQCTSAAIELGPGVGIGGAATVRAGIFRNNILGAGRCNFDRVGFWEVAAGIDPRVFEHNDIDPAGAPTALYVDEGAVWIVDPALVDALDDPAAGIAVSGTLSADPHFVAPPGDLHVRAGSPCDGAGTGVGAPLTDMDGEARDLAAPTIGADEI